MVADGDEDADKPVDPTWFCRTCFDWLGENLPDHDARDIVTVIKKDDAEGRQLKDALLESHQPANNKKVVGKPIKMTDMEDMGFLIEEPFELLTYKEYKEETKKCPKQNNAKLIKKRSFATGKIEVRYALPLKGSRPILKQYWKVSVATQTRRMLKGVSAKFRRHAAMAIQGGLKKNLARTGILALQASRMQSLAELKGKATSQGNPSSGALAQTGRSIVKKSEGSDSDAEAERPENECSDGGDDILNVPKPRKDISSSSTNATSHKQGIVLGSHPIVIPRKRTQHDTKFALGTAKHWIERSPPHEAVLGLAMQREINQLKLIQGHKSTSQIEQDLAKDHIEVLGHSITLQRENLVRLTRSNKKKASEALEKENMSWPLAVQFDIISFDAGLYWQEIKEYNYMATEDTKKALGDILKVFAK